VVLWMVKSWRKEGIPVCATVDAGPNVHVLVESAHANWVEQQLSRLPGISQIYKAQPGDGARLI